MVRDANAQLGEGGASSWGARSFRDTAASFEADRGLHLPIFPSPN
jgi:hypothetical protein